MRVLFVLWLLTTVAHADADEDLAFCTKEWPKLSAKKAERDFERCADFYAGASLGAPWVWQSGRDELLDLQSRFIDCKSDCCETKCQNAMPAFFKIQKAGQSHFSMIDPVTEKSIEPTLEKLLTGKRITASDLAGVASVTLWKFRNAPYARHGRPFKTYDLAVLFYSARAEKNDMRGEQTLLPVKQNPAFKESMLDKIDKQNVATVMAEIKQRGEK